MSIYSSKGLSGACISGEVASGTDLFTQASHGMYQLVFVTPEIIIENRKWRKMLENDVYAERLKAFVIDEAHCVKKW